MTYQETVITVTYLGMGLANIFFVIVVMLTCWAVIDFLFPRKPKPVPALPDDAQDDERAFDTTDEQA